MDKKVGEVVDTAMESQTPASSMIDFLSVLTKYRKFISRFIVICTVGTLIIALLLPKWYKSTASVFPAEKADLLGGLEGIGSLGKSLASAKSLASFGSNPETDRYLAILKSGTVLRAVIQKFDLVHVYDITSYPGEKTAKALLDNVEFKAEDEGYITISVYDKDPRRAADMANYFVAMLNKTNTEMQVQNARGNRQFIETRYEKNISDLARAEDSLKAFQKKYGVVALPEQIEASIKAAAEISGQLAKKEVQMNVYRRTQSEDNPSVVESQIEIEELRNKLSQMNSGLNISRNEMNVFIPFGRMPDLGGEYIRRFREVEIQYKTLQLMTPLYEQAKVEENRQTPSVVILDTAMPAERKSKPKVSLYVLLACVLSTLASLLLIFTYEGFYRIRDTDPVRFKAIISRLRSDWFGLVWKRNLTK